MGKGFPQPTTRSAERRKLPQRGSGGQERTNERSYVSYRMALLWVTFSDIEGQFGCLKPLCPFATVVRVTMHWRSNTRCRQQQW